MRAITQSFLAAFVDLSGCLRLCEYEHVVDLLLVGAGKNSQIAAHIVVSETAVLREE